MQRQLAVTLGLLSVIALLLGTVAAVEAATVRGAPIQIEGLDVAGATLNDQMSIGVGRVIAMGVGFLGALATVFGYIGPGMIAGVGGFGAALLPGAISSTFEAAPAADGVVATLSPVLRVLQGFVGDRLLYDPVFYGALVVALLLLMVSRRQHPPVATV